MAIATDTRFGRLLTLLVRHSRLTDGQGHCIGCLCQDNVPPGRVNHLRHLARVIDAFIDTEIRAGGDRA